MARSGLALRSTVDEEAVLAANEWVGPCSRDELEHDRRTTVVESGTASGSILCVRL